MSHSCIIHTSLLESHTSEISSLHDEKKATLENPHTTHMCSTHWVLSKEMFNLEHTWQLGGASSYDAVLEELVAKKKKKRIKKR